MWCVFNLLQLFSSLSTPNNNSDQSSTSEIAVPFPSSASPHRRRCSTGDKYLSSINEQANLQNMSGSTRSVSTIASEPDTQSELSVASQDESAQWTSPRHGNGSHEDRNDANSKEMMVRRCLAEEGLPSIAEAGNRLSQLDFQEASPTNAALSVVDIAYDL